MDLKEFRFREDKGILITWEQYNKTMEYEQNVREREIGILVKPFRESYDHEGWMVRLPFFDEEIKYDGAGPMVDHTEYCRTNLDLFFSTLLGRRNDAIFKKGREPAIFSISP